MPSYVQRRPGSNGPAVNAADHKIGRRARRSTSVGSEIWSARRRAAIGATCLSISLPVSRLDNCLGATWAENEGFLDATCSVRRIVLDAMCFFRHIGDPDAMYSFHHIGDPDAMYSFHHIGDPDEMMACLPRGLHDATYRRHPDTAVDVISTEPGRPAYCPSIVADGMKVCRRGKHGLGQHAWVRYLVCWTRDTACSRSVDCCLRWLLTQAPAAPVQMSVFALLGHLWLHATLAATSQQGPLAEAVRLQLTRHHLKTWH